MAMFAPKNAPLCSDIVVGSVAMFCLSGACAGATRIDKMSFVLERSATLLQPFLLCALVLEVANESIF